MATVDNQTFATEENDTELEAEVSAQLANETDSGTEQHGTSGFFSALSRYYAQFLETDFKKTRLPKRRLENKDRKGRRVGTPLKKYPGFEHRVWKALREPIGSGYEFTIPKGTYTATLPQTTLNAVRREIDALSGDDLKERINHLLHQAKQHAAKNPDPEIFRDDIFENVRKLLSRQTISPLLTRLDSFFDSASSPVDQLIQLEDELSGYLIAPLIDNSNDALTSLLVDNEEEPLHNAVDEYLSIDRVKTGLTTFFDDFSAGDLFVDLREMLAVEQLVENVQFYLHMGEVHYKNIVFPLFYLPMNVDMDGASIGLTSEPRVYVNKKALDYISDDLRRADQTHTPNLIKDRIYYLETGEAATDKMEEVIAPVMLSMSLTGDVDFQTTRVSEAKSSAVKMNNRLSLSLFDQSDESMVNDYEALLTGLAGGGQRCVVCNIADCSYSRW